MENAVLDGYIVLKGFVGRDAFGRVYVDRCASDEEHLARAQTPPGKERPGCRQYLADIIPADLIGKKLEIEIDIRITPCTGDTNG